MVYTDGGYKRGGGDTALKAECTGRGRAAVSLVVALVGAGKPTLRLLSWPMLVALWAWMSTPLSSWRAPLM